MKSKAVEFIKRIWSFFRPILTNAGSLASIFAFCGLSLPVYFLSSQKSVEKKPEINIGWISGFSDNNNYKFSQVPFQDDTVLVISLIPKWENTDEYLYQIPFGIINTIDSGNNNINVEIRDPMRFCEIEGSYGCINHSRLQGGKRSNSTSAETFVKKTLHLNNQVISLNEFNVYTRDILDDHRNNNLLPMDKHTYSIIISNDSKQSKLIIKSLVYIYKNREDIDSIVRFSLPSEVNNNAKNPTLVYEFAALKDSTREDISNIIHTLTCKINGSYVYSKNNRLVESRNFKFVSSLQRTAYYLYITSIILVIICGLLYCFRYILAYFYKRKNPEKSYSFIYRLFFEEEFIRSILLLFFIGIMVLLSFFSVTFLLKMYSII